ncbi:hypothetical protein PITC_034440 [Penicillium italicum]|uniref:Uncharacterized protein n=1 Tax=Penicillium italicum TaxID=40296 RepID=A0A0A2LG60_PENIT|nr:hypothetical protein PITC_034440 [Penicillium italicum]
MISQIQARRISLNYLTDIVWLSFRLREGQAGLTLQTRLG